METGLVILGAAIGGKELVQKLLGPTSKSLPVAIHYANEGGVRIGYVAFVRRSSLAAHGIKEFDVANCSEVLKPEDSEVILFDNTGKPMPKGIIEGIYATSGLSQ